MSTVCTIISLIIGFVVFPLLLFFMDRGVGAVELGNPDNIPDDIM